ncbi:type I restriction-modification system subunit M [Parvicella tangerina]|uniref:site-specific DNA-methyltransferase (adenine-specific) n=1 Tax=Parvicella tangerina TaxID=2829795 RepID=A0A916NPV7_9FLAO|nr:type I restriction-modification system subunit M [Parvicella tangerina]CAG5077579.1 Type I restriction enzyme EcoKI M protein [Parvicella tangerina]
MSKVTQQEINQLAWNACDTFRGVVDPAEYKNYILVFLFLKYISDVWKDKKEQYAEKYDGDDQRVNRAMSRERFIIPDGCTYYDIYEQRGESNIGEIINKALDAIEEANKGKLDGVFRNIDFNSESNLGETKDRARRLKNLIEDFSNEKLDFRPSHVGNQDIIGNTYEYLISHFASDAGKRGGEFYTPAEVSELLARLLEPEEGMRIYDPACGSGSLLIKVAREIDSTNFSVYGQESNGSTWALCKMNMFLHELDNAQIEWGDTLNNPKLTEGDHLMKFDRVVANPPFSLDKWGAENAENDRYNRFWRGAPPKSKADYAFITHMIESSVEGTGKVGVIVPHGVLFRGSSEGRIRQKLIEENLLEAVIGLPAQLFFGTGIPAAILIFNRGKQTNDVLFIDASSEYAEGKKQNRLREEDLKKIVETYEGFKSIDKYSQVVSFDELKENEFNLNIPRYVDTFEEEEEIDVSALRGEIKELEDELSKVRKQMDMYLDELGF